MPGVITEKVGNVGVVTLNEPDSLNAMTPDLLAAMRTGIEDVSRSAGIRALVLR